MKPPSLEDKPPGLPFHGVDRMWSVSVAQILLWNFRAMPSNLHIDEFWLTDEYALYLRHVRGDTKLGMRFGELGINPTTGTPPIDSEQEGDYLYWTIFDTPPQREWTDEFGCEWWGDAPERSWSDAVDGARLITFVERAENRGA
ncbi:hypothetical protein ACQPZA_35285 [Pseudonocardia xinjiangensis]|uniref:hypothetical protein n=1 Tax=Pseudonocardia xinjiangensis TaxID=75289 RepID=UPI003D93F13C